MLSFWLVPDDRRIANVIHWTALIEPTPATAPAPASAAGWSAGSAAGA